MPCQIYILIFFVKGRNKNRNEMKVGVVHLMNLGFQLSCLHQLKKKKMM